MRLPPPTSLLPAALAIALAGVLWWKLRSDQTHADNLLAKVHENPQATTPDQAEQQPARSAPAFGESEKIPPPIGPAASVAELEAELAALVSRIAQQTKALEAKRSDLVELQSRILIGDDELVTSFGKFTDLGREVGQVVLAFTDILAPGVAGGEVNKPPPEMGEELIDRFLKIVSWTSPVGEMESIPADIAEFQSAALHHFYGLEEGVAEKLKPVIAEHFTGMVAEGVTVASRPDADGIDDWKLRRSAALGALMTELRPMLPERSAFTTSVGLSSILNFGSGVESRGELEPDGESGNTNIVLPSWPTPPWLSSLTTP